MRALYVLHTPLWWLQPAGANRRARKGGRVGWHQGATPPPPMVLTGTAGEVEASLSAACQCQWGV
jgi:hypothetical protein